MNKKSEKNQAPVSAGVKLGELSAPRGATHRAKRLGFGESSGHGKTSGKGQKGQRSRSGHAIRAEFEGGQMPLIRRLPKRGFHHVRRISVGAVNLLSLNRFPANSLVDPAVLKGAGLVASSADAVKILGDGELTHPLTVKAHRFSKSALGKIAAAGGKAETIGHATGAGEQL